MSATDAFGAGDKLKRERGSKPRKPKLPVVAHDKVTSPRKRRHPSWIRVKLPTQPSFFELRKRAHELEVHTVCESAGCPNIGECWTKKTLTIMILGDICTRSCRFCDVALGKPLAPDPGEPLRVATMLAELDLEHTVITCVDRDDLNDGGASHWADTIAAVKQACPKMTLEALTGEFQGRIEHLDVVLDADPDVFSHNLETVPRLSREVRVQASYSRSYQILKHAAKRGAVTKTGMMVGLGESIDEVKAVLEECRALGVDIFTLGQYLAPSAKHMPIERYWTPEEFDEVGQFGRDLGFAHIESGPLVRSSYRADGQAQLVRRARKERSARRFTTA